MKREDIEEAAREESGIWAPAPLHLQDIYRRDDFEAGFHSGANWRIDSVWNDATEKPKLGELIIVEVYGKIWDYGEYDVCDTIHPKARWAYIKDLIPNTYD